MNITLVFAVCPTKGVSGETHFAFGLDDKLPWGHIRQDMRNFYKRTQGTMLVMGAKTFMSLPNLLDGRPHMVVTKRNGSLPRTKSGQMAEYYIFDDEYEKFLETGKCGGMAAWDRYKYTDDLSFHQDYVNISVIGGASLIATTLKYANQVIKTIIRKRHYVNHTVRMDKEVIHSIAEDFKVVEFHFWEIDELTTLMEDVMVRRTP